MDILTPLYREGGLLFLLDEYLSLAADKIRGRRRSAISFTPFSHIQIFFHIHLDLSLLKSGRSADICVPQALT